MTAPRLFAITLLPILAYGPAITPCALAAGDLPGVEVTATIDKDRITIGDVFGYEVRISAPEGARIDTPDLAEKLAPLEIRDLKRTDETSEGRLNVTLAYRLQVFEVGKRTISGLEIPCLLPGKEKAAPARVPGVTLQVAGVVPPDARDIQDIRDPVPIRMKRSDWLLAALIAVLLIAALVVLGLWIARCMRNRRQRPEPPKIVTAHSWALSRLADLEQRNLPALGDCPGHYAELTEILREFVEARFDLPANEGTTATLLRDLWRADADPGFLQPLVAVLKEADRVRFGRIPVGPADAKTALETAREAIWIAGASEPEPDEGGAG